MLHTTLQTRKTLFEEVAGGRGGSMVSLQTSCMGLVIQWGEGLRALTLKVVSVLWAPEASWVPPPACPVERRCP